MKPSFNSRKLLSFLIILFIFNISSKSFSKQKIVKYVRFEINKKINFGIIKNGIVTLLKGNIFKGPQKTNKKYLLKNIKLLPPTDASKVIAVGLNYSSHSGNSGAAKPGIFSKFPTSLTGHKSPIIMHKGAKNLHYEGEMVVVIGKKCRKVSIKKASSCVFGITAGNDVSERNWQFSDLQWIRGKASDTFGPIGPYLVTGLDYNNILIQTRLNGKIVQSESTKNMIHNVDKIISYISNYVTLLPGDVIFTGTLGSTSSMKIGDVIEVELKGVGILKNKIIKDK